MSSEPVATRAQGALTKLRALGGRVTVARIEVLNVLEKATDHLTVDAIAALVQEAHPAVHRATVYRTLDSLVEAGVVSHTHMGRGAAVYHLADATHVHVQCQTCGRIIDVDASVLAPVAERLLSQHDGFILHPAHSALLGTCAGCAASEVR